MLAWLGFLALCFLAALSGAFFRPGAWHARLHKPRWHPPNRLFGPAWALLYLLIATAGWLVWRADGLGLALAVWGLQLLLNAGWSWLFFGLRRPDWAFAEVLLLWASILVCVVLFWPVSVTAALLMLPYLAWVGFAAALNLALWRMNGPRPA